MKYLVKISIFGFRRKRCRILYFQNCVGGHFLFLYYLLLGFNFFTYYNKEIKLTGNFK